ncbi:MAG: HAMP domain-containing protein [Anaerolineales bacterium]|nr:HAMP domain-containing protein [Anaerolineales bacterium]
MSLQIRLAMFYAVLVGAALLAFGLAVYNQSTEILMQQIDVRLESAIKDAGNALRWQNSETMITYDASILLQLYDSNGELINATETTQAGFLPGEVIDPEGLTITLQTRQEYSAELVRGNLHYKALSVPVMVDQFNVGVLQAGTSLTAVDRLRVELLRSLVLIGLVITVVAASVGYYMARTALAPLATVTEIAGEITRSDDLSLRIPEGRNKTDEVGLLIAAFNETMVRLEHLFNAQRRFIADVSHELRTPLTVLKGNAGLMRRMNHLDMEALDSMSNEISRLTRMVEDLLLMAQAESGRLEIELIPVEMDSLLLEVYQQARILAGEKKQFQIVDIDQLIVLGDRDRLKQVLLNLISNAIKYTAVDGEILLRLYNAGDEVRLEVKDNGCGIHEDELEKIFERFYRVERSRSKMIDYDKKGFGLGLSIAYLIMVRHAGRILVESEVGVGSVFTMCLPKFMPEN